MMILPGGLNLWKMVRDLRATQATPRDLISVLQNIKGLGALQADLEIF